MNSRLKLTILGSFVIFAVVTASAQTSGADIYKAKCQMCHAADGTASTPAGKAMKARSFKSPAAITMTDAEMIALINKGKGKMPSYSGKLTENEIKQVVEHIRKLQHK